MEPSTGMQAPRGREVSIFLPAFSAELARGKHSTDICWMNEQMMLLAHQGTAVQLSRLPSIRSVTKSFKTSPRSISSFLWRPWTPAFLPRLSTAISHADPHFHYITLLKVPVSLLLLHQQSWNISIGNSLCFRISVTFLPWNMTQGHLLFLKGMWVWWISISINWNICELLSFPMNHTPK